MAQLIEFISNHPLPVLAFVATLAMIAFTEYQRVFSGVEGLTPFVATQRLNEGNTLFVDVRSENEYKSGHIINAKLMPLMNFDKQIHELEKYKEKDVLVYCESGMRASKFANKLKKNGFTNLYTLTGGLSAWEKANLPVVTK